jgi:hypothetical protein
MAYLGPMMTSRIRQSKHGQERKESGGPPQIYGQARPRCGFDSRRLFLLLRRLLLLRGGVVIVIRFKHATAASTERQEQENGED